MIGPRVRIVVGVAAAVLAVVLLLEEGASRPPWIASRPPARPTRPPPSQRTPPPGSRRRRAAPPRPLRRRPSRRPMTTPRPAPRRPGSEDASTSAARCRPASSCASPGSRWGSCPAPDRELSSTLPSHRTVPSRHRRPRAKPSGSTSPGTAEVPRCAVIQARGTPGSSSFASAPADWKVGSSTQRAAPCRVFTSATTFAGDDSRRPPASEKRSPMTRVAGGSTTFRPGGTRSRRYVPWERIATVTCDGRRWIWRTGSTARSSSASLRAMRSGPDASDGAGAVPCSRRASLFLTNAHSQSAAAPTTSRADSASPPPQGPTRSRSSLAARVGTSCSTCRRTFARSPLPLRPATRSSFEITWRPTSFSSAARSPDACCAEGPAPVNVGFVAFRPIPPDSSEPPEHLTACVEVVGEDRRFASVALPPARYLVAGLRRGDFVDLVGPDGQPVVVDVVDGGEITGLELRVAPP